MSNANFRKIRQPDVMKSDEVANGAPEYSGTPRFCLFYGIVYKVFRVLHIFLNYSVISERSVKAEKCAHL